MNAFLYDVLVWVTIGVIAVGIAAGAGIFTAWVLICLMNARIVDPQTVAGLIRTFINSLPPLSG
jgi:hypothetical protein